MSFASYELRRVELVGITKGFGNFVSFLRSIVVWKVAGCHKVDCALLHGRLASLLLNLN